LKEIIMAVEYKDLDVRPILEAGVEPFAEIMASVNALAPDQGLRLIAPFKPQPLFSVMARKGFRHEVLELEDGDFEVRFLPETIAVRASDDADGADAWPDPAVELDLTDLDPPQPMLRILQTLETLPTGAVLFAALGREPILLYPELVKRGHQWVGNYDKSGETFRVMIRRGETAA
jgi:uncharacterized protein (DUF2249 family)